jgi:hypothetical protein
MQKIFTNVSGLLFGFAVVETKAGWSSAFSDEKPKGMVRRGLLRRHARL